MSPSSRYSLRVTFPERKEQRERATVLDEVTKLKERFPLEYWEAMKAGGEVYDEKMRCASMMGVEVGIKRQPF